MSIMHSRPVRGLLAAHFALLSLLGQGLHWLGNCEHAHDQPAVCCHLPAASSNEHCEHGDCPGRSHGLHLTAGQAGTHDADDCAVCNYFAAAKATLGITAAIESADACLELAAATPPAAPATPLQAFSARGPPPLA